MSLPYMEGSNPPKPHPSWAERAVVKEAKRKNMKEKRQVERWLCRQAPP
jgi:hypothetical protein